MEREANRIKIENLIATGRSNNVFHDYILEYIQACMVKLDCRWYIAL